MSRILAPVVLTLAKTSHTRRTGASRWIHRACACNTMRFRSTGLARYTRATRWVRVVRAHQRSLLLSLPVASQENLSSCIQKLAIVMHGKAWTEIDNSRDAEAKADTTSGVGRNGAWHPQTTCPYKPRARATHHGRDARRTCCREHPAWPCSFLYYTSRQCQPCRQYRACTPQRVSF